MSQNTSAIAWVLGSGALHAWWLLAVPSAPVPLAPRASESAQQVWLEEVRAPTAAPETAQPSLHEEEEGLPPPRAELHPASRAARRARAARPRPARRAEAADGVAAAGLALEGQDGQEGEVAVAAGTSAESTTADSAEPGAGDEISPPAQRKQISAQLSLWLDPPQLAAWVIVRSTTAVLSAVPGYRDMLRSSGLRVFSNMRRLRVFLPGLSAEHLALAGVHSGGQTELVRAAERTAAARERLPTWRGDAELRATSWVDGSEYDRGLALHGDAFLIGARAQLPALLGAQGPGRRVSQLSRTRRGVMLLVALHDVARYVPELAPCELVRLRVSVSSTLRMSVVAEYETPAHAAHAAVCLAGLQGTAAQLPFSRELLSRASAPAGGDRSYLNTGVTSAELTSFLDELCWSLRRVPRS